MEVVVRPVVFPNIRPSPAQPLPAADDPTKGFATIHGNGGKLFDLSYSYSASTTSSAHSEIKRRVDKGRVYQKDPQGNINRNNFVDQEVPNKFWIKGPPVPVVKAGGNAPGADDASSSGQNTQLHYYSPLRGKDNIEVKERNVIIEGGSGGGE